MASGIWVVFLLLPSLICCSACSQDERNSLLDFKQGINFTYSREYQLKPLESWRGLNCCTWEGVACHPHTAHVITLDLSHSDLLWSEVRGGLFQLLHLEHLDLSNNYFPSLSIPPQIGELRRLKYLRLSECGFTGRIPRELTKLQQLEHLDLSDNDLHGAIPREMGNISTLKFLDLSWNDGLQSNKLGEWITHLRGLEVLDLGRMNLSVAGDTWLASLANLTALLMYDCGLSGEIPPSFANLSRLQGLALGRNSFRGAWNSGPLITNTTNEEEDEKFVGILMIPTDYDHILGLVKIGDIIAVIMELGNIEGDIIIYCVSLKR